MEQVSGFHKSIQQTLASAASLPDKDTLMAAINSAMDEKIASLEKTLQTHTLRNSMADVAKRTSVMP